MFSSNDTPAEEFKKARELGAIINLDDISHINYLEAMPVYRISSVSVIIPAHSGAATVLLDTGRSKVRIHKRTVFEGYRILRDKRNQAFRAAYDDCIQLA
jgi:diaminopimelate decarboxylase